jgi:thioester reductase-like protein
LLPDYASQAPVKEIQIEDASIPLGQGYAESKWVAEMILHAAAKATTLRPQVVRVGQISGGVNGAWNTSDWVPAIIKSSIALGCLPRLNGVRRSISQILVDANYD